MALEKIINVLIEYQKNCLNFKKKMIVKIHHSHLVNYYFMQVNKEMIRK